MMARLDLEAKYQKLWRCSGRSFLTKEMADVRRMAAAVRVMRRREGSVALKSKERRIAR